MVFSCSGTSCSTRRVPPTWWFALPPARRIMARSPARSQYATAAKLMWISWSPSVSFRSVSTRAAQVY